MMSRRTGMGDKWGAPEAYKHLRLKQIRNQQTNAKSLDLSFPKLHFPQAHPFEMSWNVETLGLFASQRSQCRRKQHA